MTPQERQLVDDLFDRLAKLESAKRDPEAMSAIMQGLRNAPNAVYALVQTALVQDEALKRADARIQELEATLGMNNEPARPAGFLDNMRNALFGRQEPPPRPGSVPSVPMGGPDGYRSGMAPGYVAGMLERDSGDMFWQGSSVHFENPAQAAAHGIAMVHQELAFIRQVAGKNDKAAPKPAKASEAPMSLRNLRRPTEQRNGSTFPIPGP
jgi:hypothetical protein